MWSQVYHGINITWHYYIQHSTINSELTKKHNSSSLVSCRMSSVSTLKKKIHDTENVLYLCWNHRYFVFAVLLSHMTNTLVAVSLSSPQIMLFVLPKQHNYMTNRLSSNLLPQPTLKATHSCNIDIFLQNFISKTASNYWKPHVTKVWQIILRHVRHFDKYGWCS